MAGEYYDDYHVGSEDYDLQDAVGNERPAAYKLSLQGWLDINLYRLEKAERVLLRAANQVDRPTKAELVGYCKEAANLVYEVIREMGGR